MDVSLSSRAHPCPYCAGAGTWESCPYGANNPRPGFEVVCEACDGTGLALCLDCGAPLGLDADGFTLDFCVRCEADAAPLTSPE